MKLSLSLTSIIFVAVVTLNGCSKDEKKVNAANAATPVKQDESPPLGEWVQDGSTNTVIFTKDKVKFPAEESECKWLDKSPVKDEKIEGCAFYHTETTSKELLKNEFIDYYIKNIKLVEVNKLNVPKDDVSERLKDLKDSHTNDLKIIEKIKEGSYKKIDSINVDFGGGDTSQYYFYDGTNLYDIIYSFDASGNDGPGFFNIHSYSKK
jgi:hypothetical protein